MKNKWMIATIVCGTLVLASMAFMGGYFLSRGNSDIRNPNLNLPNDNELGDDLNGEPEDNLQNTTTQQTNQPNNTTRTTTRAAGGNNNQGNRPSNPSISLERAIQIATADLNNRGISATYRTNSGMSWERNQWVWELEFRPNGARGVIEYYINVNTGAIVKFEWDR